MCVADYAVIFFLVCKSLFLQDFHELSQKLLLWVASAESRRHKAQIADPNPDPHTIVECQTELMVCGALITE